MKNTNNGEIKCVCLCTKFETKEKRKQKLKRKDDGQKEKKPKNNASDVKLRIKRHLAINDSCTFLYIHERWKQHRNLRNYSLALIPYVGWQADLLAHTLKWRCASMPTFIFISHSFASTFFLSLSFCLFLVYSVSQLNGQMISNPYLHTHANNKYKTKEITLLWFISPEPISSSNKNPVDS